MPLGMYARLVPDGLFLLDEPEAALSPQRQLGLLALMKEYVDRGAQFVVATHAPILLAYPGARLYSFDVEPPRAVAFGSQEYPGNSLMRPAHLDEIRRCPVARREDTVRMP